MKIKLNEDEQDWFYAFMLNRLEKQGFEVEETRHINYGMQFRIASGQVLDLYRTLKFSCGGLNLSTHKNLHPLVCKMLADFRENIFEQRKIDLFIKKLQAA